jgi:hypothetical protein
MMKFFPFSFRGPQSTLNDVGRSQSELAHKQEFLVMVQDAQFEIHHSGYRDLIRMIRKLDNGCSIKILNASSITDCQHLFYKKLLNFDSIKKALKKLIATEASSRQTLLAGLNKEGYLNRIIVENLIEPSKMNLYSANIDYINSLSDLELEGAEWQGVPIGRFVFVDLSLSLKMSARNLNSEEQNQFMRHILFLYSLMIDRVTHILSKDNINCVLHNSLYGADLSLTNLLKCQFPLIPRRIFSMVSYRGQISGFRIFENHIEDSFLKRALAKFIPVDPFIERAISNIKDYVNINVVGRSVFTYSPEVGGYINKELKDFFPVDGRRVITYFSSSPDELVASDLWAEEVGLCRNPERIERRPYGSEFDAIKDVADSLIDLDAVLIIRLHPRLGIESRVKRSSDALPSLRMFYEKLCISNSRVFVIMPEEDIPSYWLASHSDLNLGYRSSVTTILPLLGMPVLLLSDNRGYPIAYYEDIVLKKRDLLLQSIKEVIGVPIDEGILYRVLGFYIMEKVGTFDSGAADRGGLEKFQKALDTGFSVLSEEFNYAADLTHGQDQIINDDSLYVNYLDWLTEVANNFSINPNNKYKMKIEAAKANVQFLQD